MKNLVLLADYFFVVFVILAFMYGATQNDIDE